jgi:hypothetical protein
MAGGQPSAAHTTFEVTPGTAPADGATAVTLKVTVRDAQGTPVVGYPVTIHSVGPGDRGGGVDPQQTGTDGVFTELMDSTIAHTETVTATIGSFMLSQQVTFTESPAITNSAVSVTPGWLPANQGSAAATILVTVRDGSGVAMANQTVSLTVSGSGNTLGATGGQSDGSGHFTTTLSSTQAESKVVTASIGAFSVITHVQFGQSCTGAVQLMATPVVDISNLFSATTGDMDGDGKPDLVMADLQGLVGVKLANGGGLIPAPGPAQSVGVAPWTVAVGDLNGDGKADVVASVNGAIYAMLGNGDGSLQAPRVSGTVSTSEISGLILGDFDHDGKLDAVNGDFLATSGSYLMLGSGDGLFHLGMTTLATMTGAVAGDFDGDGLLDELEAYPGAVVLDVSARTPTAKSFPSNNQSMAVVGDWNHDGKLDAATGTAAQVLVLLGNGDGTFGMATSYSITVRDRPAAMGVADLNGDGVPDILVGHADTGVSVMYGKGDGTFLVSDYPALPLVGWVFAMDVNDDGKPDLAALGYDGSAYHLQIFANAGCP